MVNFPESSPLLTYKYKLRSRYSETDKMGYVYHGKFLEYFEVARVEMIRSYGIDYRMMEDEGIMLPVVEANIDFKLPVLYDEPILVKVHLFDKPSIRLRTYYEVEAIEREQLCVQAQVTLFFMNEKRRRPCKAPSYFLDRFEQAIQEVS